MIRLAEKKHTGLLIFHVHATYKILRFKHRGFLGFPAAKKCYGQMDGQAQTNMPPLPPPPQKKKKKKEGHDGPG